MDDRLTYAMASSEQIEVDLGRRVMRIRLTRNITQAALSQEAGVSLRTLRRLENGEGVSLDTFLRVLIALGIQDNLRTLLPDPGIRPMERIMREGRERQRASSRKKRAQPAAWQWGDEQDEGA